MKQIKIDDNTKEDLINKFKDFLNKGNFTTQNISFTTQLPKPTNNQRMVLCYSTKAYLKTLLYIQETNTEIAWHGTVYRENNYFYVDDVMLYPQYLQAITVTTDQEKYNKWIEELPDEKLNHLRLQGHSHVNMNTNPSGVDITYYESILNILPNNEYYIFTIMNKQGSITTFIYDLATNTLYESEDIDIIVLDEETNILEDIKNEKEKYCSKPIIIQRETQHQYYNDLYGYRDYNSDTPTDKFFDELDRKWEAKQAKKYKKDKFTI